jgi:23S rRNA (adenine2503-C2)-methyltransferase
MEIIDQKSLIENPSLTKKVNLKGMTIDELEDFFLEIGEHKYRSEQIFHWMYNKLSVSFFEMENFSKELRNKLNGICEIKGLEYVDSKVSEESGTKKYIFKTSDDLKIESVLIPEESRKTLCISTQVGCPLDCKFCATGLMGYKKNLTPGEIIDQYLLVAKDVGKDYITNIVYMGMGEPLLNYHNTLKSLEILASSLTKGISLKKVTVSTAGIAPKIIALADSGLKPKLALSLHSCFDEIRSLIMPINNKYPIHENVKAIRHYAKSTGTRITFEYVMLKDINDRDVDIKELVKLCKEIPSKVNIIPFNSLKHMSPKGFSAKLQPTPRERIDDFVKKLLDKNITVTVRYTQGTDIAAACGQLAIKYK